MGTKRKTKTDKFLDKVLITIAIFDAFFVIAMIVIFCIFQSVPDTLILAVAGCTFGEAGCCSYVFKQKMIKKENTDVDG